MAANFFNIRIKFLEYPSESDDGHPLKGGRDNLHTNCQPVFDLKRDPRNRRSKGNIQYIAARIVAVVHAIEFEFLN